jgi:GNAT superfamily N-acetyltransferase
VTVEIVQVEPRFAAALAELERQSFPTAAEDELLSVEGVLLQCEVFPEGGFVVLDGEEVVGFALGCFVDFDFDHPVHHIDEVVGPLGCDNHDPHAPWSYGTDIAVRTDQRGRGIGHRLYEVRKDLVRRHNRRGIVAGGVIPGFADHKHEMTADEYIAKVAAGELRDPTLTFQISNGFEALGAIPGYWTDPAVDDHACLIVWRNPDHDPDALAAEQIAAG